MSRTIEVSFRTGRMLVAGQGWETEVELKTAELRQVKYHQLLT